MRRVLAALALAVVCSAAAIGTAPGAQAHAKLRTSSPAAGSTVKKAPSKVVLTFSTSVREKSVVVEVDGPDGSDAASGPAAVAGRVVTQPLGTAMANGDYVIRWKATANDGHKLSGTVPFTLRAPAAAAPAATSTPTAAASPSASVTPTATSAVAGVAATPSPTGADDAGTPAQPAEGAAVWPVVAAVGAAAAVVGGLVVVRRRRGAAG